MRSLLLLALAALPLITTGAFAAIPVELSGSSVWTFDTLPAASEWSATYIAGAAADILNESQLDAAVQTNSAARITATFISSTGNPPGGASQPQWSSSGRYIQTRPAGVVASLVMATLANAASLSIWAFDVQYDLAVPVTPFGEEVPGHRIYYSLSGVPNSWVMITNVSVAGPQAFTIYFPGGWNAGNTMYLLFGDDNATTNPDGAYQIDNFRVANVIHGDPSCVGITVQPQGVTVPERGTATFSLMATGSPQIIQWYRSDDGGVNYLPLSEGRSNSYRIAEAKYPEDNGARFLATVSNSLCMVTSSVATLTVNPDTNPPVVIRARGELSPDTVILTFSEDINPLTVSPDNFILFETGTDPAATPYLTFDATLANGTNINLLTDSREPGKNYSVRVLYLEDTASQANPIVPTNVPIRQLIQLIGFDTDNVWKYDINNGDRFGTGWEMVGYDDSAWPSGLAGLGFDSSNNGVPIRTQLPYQGNSVPVYFRRHFTLPGTNGLVLTLRDVVEDGAVYFLNGQEVFRHNVGPGPLTFTTRAMASQTDPTPIMGPYTLSATNLWPGDNVIAVVVLQTGATSGDIDFAAELSAEISSICSCATRILVQPRSQSPREGESFSLTAVVEGVLPLFYQWRKNGTNIPGATYPTLYFPSAASSDAGAYDVVASNSFSSVTSLVANIVMGDPWPPPVFLSAIGSTNLTNITLTFSEPLAMASAQSLSNYDVQRFIGGGSLTIFSAVLTNGTNVILATSPRNRSCGSYWVIITNLTDSTAARQSVTPHYNFLREEIVILAPDFIHEWRYDQSGVDRSGTGWQAIHYDDTQAGWAGGPAGFASIAAGQEIAPSGFEFRSFSLNAGISGGPVTTYFRTHFFWPTLAEDGSVLKWAGVVDDGAVFYINGVEAGRIRMTNGTIAFTDFATGASPENSNVHFSEGPFVLNATNLNSFGDNVLAIELHQSATNSPDAALSIQLIAEIGSIILPSPQRMSIRRDANTGEITIQWPGCGTLQQTTGALDQTWFLNWSDVPGNPNPYRFTPTGEGKVFRVRP